MGLGVIKNILMGPMGHELFQHPTDPGIVGIGVQLAVGKGPRAAFAELNVALRVQLAALPEFFHFPVAGLGVLAPLQNDGAAACLGQNQPGEHSRGAEAHNDGPVVGGDFGDRICEGKVPFHIFELLFENPFLPAF